jgi:hypothetical protein
VQNECDKFRRGCFSKYRKTCNILMFVFLVLLRAIAGVEFRVQIMFSHKKYK